ncbi:hypothetical protein D6779_08250 [Candidatus Parcubacteria bacterium]|nr:MAG: hypothetical protein D6779_08250 [Candidatus Parcubacteria bacterium]
MVKVFMRLKDDDKKISILFVHDNHVIGNLTEDLRFANATFHLFLLGFNQAVLSAPCESMVHGIKDSITTIDGVSVWLRPGYGRAINFYLKG